ncbi:hypothetical protein AVEN_192176-1 [Araneus ventricosus]|uniref:Protein inscuteable homologue C-terminal domain-containing protein n=1 Tax=Araneus ventricosus TaxID=182803 RepID=A0A4Y2SAQ3_ARAVE|nr:hypothetical protein AVEN_192176-1 [Araneus ventricosus]
MRNATEDAAVKNLIGCEEIHPSRALQVGTVLANMAAKDDYRVGLSSGGSLVLLLCFLQLRPSSAHGAPQLEACERIQQKAAIALARLCCNPETCNVVAEMQGKDLDRVSKTFSIGK